MSFNDSEQLDTRDRDFVHSWLVEKKNKENDALKKAKEHGNI